MNRYSSVLIVLTALSAWTSSYAQEADKIYPRAGAVATGTITEMTRNNMVVEVRGTKENFPANDILRIVYETEPPQLSRAKEAVLGGQWEDALESLKKVDINSISRDVVKKEFEFYVGLVQTQLALQGQGDPQAAETRLKNYVASDPQSFHFYATADLLGALATATGGYDRAAKYFAALAGSPFAEHKLRAQYMLGKSNLALGKVAEARSAFGDAISASADNQEAKRFQKLSRLGLLRCDTADKKAGDAIKSLRTMVAENDATDSQLFSQIYNALGEAHREADQVEEALLAYLHTDLLFTSEPDNHAEALYHLSQLFLKSDPQRAADAKSRLQSLYGNSAWAKK